MKPFLSRIAIALLVASIASVSAFAKTTKHSVKFPTNIKVNGTVVNKGVYDLKFDEETGELVIVKDDKVIARAAASSAKRDRKARNLEIKSTGTGDDVQLISIAFSGSDRDVVLNGSQATR
jgi:Na+-translocating ferredoxin:NAD+ oxidoreductase RnfE subunit